MAAQDTRKAKPCSLEDAMMAEGVNGVARTGGIEAAISWQYGRDKQLVAPDQTHDQSPRQMPERAVGKTCQVRQIPNSLTIGIQLLQGCGQIPDQG